MQTQWLHMHVQTNCKSKVNIQLYNGIHHCILFMSEKLYLSLPQLYSMHYNWTKKEDS